MDKSQEINVDTIAKVFDTLPHLKQVVEFSDQFNNIWREKSFFLHKFESFQSRDIILKLLESKVGDFWRHYSTRDILEMLRNMTAVQFGSERVLKVVNFFKFLSMLPLWKH